MPQYQNQIQDKRLCEMEKSLKVINSEMGDVKIDVVKIKTDVDWLKRFFWIIAVSSIGALLTGLFNLIIK